MQWYPGDWRKDPGVQCLSYEERGIWFEILMLMHDCEPRGKLILNSQPISQERLGLMLRLTTDQISQTISQLISLGVAGLDDGTGALMCRRMVRDEEKRQKLSGYGKLGGNPAFEKGKDNPYHKPPDKPKHKPEPKPNISPSSSSSTSVLQNNTTPPKRVAPSEPSIPAFDGPDPEQLVSAAVEACAQFWPNIGDKRYARSSWAREAAGSAKGIGGWCEAIVITARQHAPAQVNAKTINKRHFIPTLDKWVSSGDYTSPPPKVIHQQNGPVDLGRNLDGNT